MADQDKKVNTSHEKRHDQLGELLEHKGYCLFHNEMTMETELEKVDENGNVIKKRFPMSDFDFAEILDEIRYFSKDWKELTNHRFVEMAMKDYAKRNKSYHPVLDALGESKPVTENAFDEFISCLEFESEPEAGKEFFHFWMKLFLIRFLYPEESTFTQNFALTILGPQGLGKSTLARRLCEPFGLRYYYEGQINPDNKDHRIRLARFLIWLADEGGSTLRKRDMDEMKGFLTQEVINERLPYDKFPVYMKRVTNFIFTHNDKQILVDQTGNRRFGIVNLLSLDKERMNKIDMLKVWQYVAYEIHHTAVMESWDAVIEKHMRLPSWLTEAQKRINDAHMVDNPLEDKLMEIVEITGNDNEYIKKSELLDRIKGANQGFNSGYHYSDNALAKKISEIMIKNGAKTKVIKIDRAPCRVWYRASFIRSSESLRHLHLAP